MIGKKTIIIKPRLLNGSHDLKDRSFLLLKYNQVTTFFFIRCFPTTFSLPSQIQELKNK